MWSLVYRDCGKLYGIQWLKCGHCMCAKWNIQSMLAEVSSTVSSAEGASKTSYVVISCLKLFTSCYCTTCEDASA